MLAAPAPHGLGPAAQRVAALAVWMAAWWLTAAIPLEATALLPLALLPLLGVSGIETAAAPYANPVIFLFLGGFFLAAALERWNLHRRLALGILAAVGTDARRVVLAFMLATGFVSMWISNTAAAVMMLPLGSAVLKLAERRPEERDRRAEDERREPHRASQRAGSGTGTDTGALGTALMLGIAYAASIGGVATLIGTPPNAIFAAAAKELYGADIGFARWMLVGVPVAATLLPACWWLMVRRLFPVGGAIEGLEAEVNAQRGRLGPLAGAERFTLLVFALAALAWIAREPKTVGGLTVPGLQSLLPAISDAGIAMATAVALFAVPTSLSRREFALDWESAAKVPWGILLLFGGGLSLADAFQSSGLSEWIGRLIGVFGGQPRVVVVGAVAVLFILLTELTSNTAIAAMAMPVLAGVAAGVGQPPLVLMWTAALGCSMAFMLPVATPPNAVVFASGRITPGQMARAGIWMNLLSIAVVTAAGALLIPG